MVKKRFKISITIEKRIIIFLANYIDFKDSFEGNAAITQQGIADAIGIRFEHVPRSMKKLLDDGLVYERKAHVKGYYRRKKIYFLTTKGIEYAKELKKWFDEKKILIRNLDGEVRDIKFNQLKDFLDFKLYPLEAFKYALTSKNGIIDLNQVLSDRKQLNLVRKRRIEYFPITPTTKKDFIFSPNIPMVDTFFGRDKEIKTIQNILESDIKIIVVHGIAGIGKTTLISKVVEDFKTKTNIFWYQFEPWSSIKYVLKSLSEFLNKLGKKKLYLYFNSYKGFNLGEVIDILTTELDGINAIFVFDDFHRCDKHTLDLFFSLNRLCEKITAPKIIVIARSKLRFYDRRDVSIKKSIAEIQLTGLGYSNSRKLLNIESIDDRQFKEIYNIIKGHPVALRLLDSIESIKHQADFQTFMEFIDEQVFNELNDDEKKLLNTVCVFRYPVESDALFPKEDNISYEILLHLIQKFLIIKISPETYIMHELLIDIYYKRLTIEQKKFYHNHAADHYKKNNSDIDVMERIYHLINAHEFKYSAKLIIEFGDRLISHGYLEFFNLLEIFNDINLPMELYKEILTLKGDASIKMGNWDRALQHYEDGLILMEKRNDSENAAEVYRKMGNAYGLKGDWEKTIELHLESLKIFKAKGNKKEMAKIYNDLGMIYRQMENHEKSYKMYKKSLEIFQDINDKIGTSIIYLNMGKMNEQIGKNKNALINYKKAIKISGECNYIQGLALGHKFMGMYYHSNGKMDLAVNYLQKGLNYFNNLKNEANIIQVCIKLGEIYNKKNDYSHAIEIYKKGINHLEKNILKNKYKQKIVFHNRSKFDNINSDFITDDNIRNNSLYIDSQMSLAKLYEKVGKIYREQYNFDDALNYHTKYLNIVTEIGDDQETAIAYINIGIDQRKRQAYNQALSSYKDALKKLIAIDDKMGILTVYRNIGKIYDLKSDLKNALLNYNYSLDLSKEIQYDMGIAKAYKEIAKIYFKLGEKRRGNIYLEKAWRLLEHISDDKKIATQE